MTTRRLNRREFLRIGALAGAGAALAACATPTPQVVKETVIVEGATKVVEKVITATPGPVRVVNIAVANSDPLDVQDGYNKMVEAFNQKYAGKIKAEVKNFPGSGFTEKLAAMVAGNDAPDVWMGLRNPDDYPKYGFIQNLEPYIQGDKINKAERWFPHAYNEDLYLGNQYRVARNVDSPLFAYNKTLLEAAGVAAPTNDWTTDDLLNILIKVRNKEQGIWGCNWTAHGGIVFGASGGLPWSMGFDMLSKDGRRIQGYLDKPESIEVIQWYIDLQDKYDTAAAGNQLQALGGAAGAFTSGKLAIGTSYPELVTKGPFSFEWGLVRSPHHKNYEVHAWKGVPGWYMWSGGKRKDEAWRVMEFQSGPEGSKIMWQSKTAYPSPCPSVWRELGYDKPGSHPVYPSTYSQLLETKSQKPYFARTEHWGKCILQDFSGIWVQYIQEKKRPLEALVKEVAAKAQKCLDTQYAASG